MKPKKSMALGWGYIVAGGCFLFEPFISVFDFVPDLIGYLLILRGLRTLALLEGHFDAAIRCFRRLALLAGGRILSILVIFALMPATEQPVGHLLFTFTLGVLDCIVLYPAWRELAQGVTQAAYLYNGTAALRSDRHGRTSTDRFLRLTLVFMTLREVMSVLPEATVLLSSQSGEIDLTRWSFLYNYVGLLRLMAALPVLIVGIVWLVQLVRYIRSLSRDEAFGTSLRGAVEQYLTLHPDHIKCLAVKRATFLAGAASVLLLDIFADGITILPDAVAGVCLLCAVVALWRDAHIRANKTLCGAACFVITSALAGGMQSALLHELCDGSLMDADSYAATSGSYMLENASRMLRDPDTRAEFYLVCGLVALAQVCLIVTLLGLRRVLDRAIDRYTGVPRGREADPRFADGDADIHRSLKRNLLRATIVGCVVAVLPVVYMLTLPYAAGTPLRAFSTVNLIADVAFAACFIKVLGDIRRQMETKYLLD